MGSTLIFTLIHGINIRVPPGSLICIGSPFTPDLMVEVEAIAVLD